MDVESAGAARASAATLHAGPRARCPRRGCPQRFRLRRDVRCWLSFVAGDGDSQPGDRDSGFSRPAGEADKAGLRWFTELLGKLSAQLNPKNKESSKART